MLEKSAVLQGFLGTRRHTPAEQYANMPFKSGENPGSKSRFVPPNKSRLLR
jgi:hypothetical protein